MQKTKKPTKAPVRWLRIENDKFYLNSEKTAEFFDVTDRTIRDWDDKAGGILKLTRGWWDIKAIMEWRSGANSESDVARKLRAEADLKEEQAAKAKREREILEGQYLPVEEMSSEWARRLVEVKSGLLAMSRKIASQFSDPDIRIEVEKIASDEVYDLLDQYSRDGKYTPYKQRKGRKKK